MWSGLTKLEGEVLWMVEARIKAEVSSFPMGFTSSFSIISLLEKGRKEKEERDGSGGGG